MYNLSAIYKAGDSLKSSISGLNASPHTETCGFLLNDDSKKELADRYDTPGLKYMDIKKELIDTIINFFELNKSKREQLLKNDDEVNQKMILGRNKARQVAQDTLNKVKNAVGLP